MSYLDLLIDQAKEVAEIQNCSYSGILLQGFLNLCNKDPYYLWFMLIYSLLTNSTQVFCFLSSLLYTNLSQIYNNSIF